LVPRQEVKEPTSILLAQSLADYRKMLADQGTNLLNPAFFYAKKNRIVCAAELQRLGEQMEMAKLKNAQVLEELDKYKAELNRLYKKQIPADVQKGLDAKYKKVHDTMQANEKAFKESFEESTNRLFTRLYHESFHAYLANAVYPDQIDSVPRWLNEGLAQVFDSALLQGQDLRVGFIDAKRLERTQKLLEKGNWIGLKGLLNSGAKQFLVVHATQKEDADRHYLEAWALAYYLSFDRHLLGSKKMDQYISQLGRGTDSLEAFREMVDQPLDEFERQFKGYVKELRAGKKN
jgi:hypothetical protein